MAAAKRSARPCMSCLDALMNTIINTIMQRSPLSSLTLAASNDCLAQRVADELLDALTATHLLAKRSCLHPAVQAASQSRADSYTSEVASCQLPVLPHELCIDHSAARCPFLACRLLGPLPFHPHTCTCPCHLASWHTNCKIKDTGN